LPTNEGAQQTLSQSYSPPLLGCSPVLKAILNVRCSR
jgi:hypothetical protein